MRYVPAAIPNDTPPGLKAWLADELRRIAAMLSTFDGMVQLDPRGSPPDRPRNGMIVYADGALWNPGAGEGFYGYQAGAWVKL